MDEGARQRRREIGASLQAAREHAGLSRRRLAELGSLSHSTISRVERGQIGLTSRIAEAYARFCETNTDELLPETPEAPQRRRTLSFLRHETILTIDEQCSLMLDEVRAEVIARRDGLQNYVIGVGDTRQEAEARLANMSAIEGCELAVAPQTAGRTSRIVAQFPNPLNRGERHFFSFVNRSPNPERRQCFIGGPSHTDFIFVTFRVIVPISLVHHTKVYRVERLTPFSEPETVSGLPEIAATSNGVFVVDFHNLEPGLGYGVQWDCDRD